MTQRLDDTSKEGRTSPLFVYIFSTETPKGRVNGTRDRQAPTHAPLAGLRHITDAERIISIDHGALRIPMLAKPGFGRAALSYGPFDAKPGLAMAVWMLNGHNTSQTLHTYSLLKQAYRFLRGGNAFSIPEQLSGWYRHPAREDLCRRIECWLGVRFAKNANIRDNLMVGFFARADRPVLGACSSSFVMRAASHECGDLRVTLPGRIPDDEVDEVELPSTCLSTSVVYGMQNVDALFVVVLRADAAIHYLSTTPCARGSASAGTMRPVAVMRKDAEVGETGHVFVGVHQAVLGEIGFAVDTRVHGVAVDVLPELAPRFGGAHVASEDFAREGAFGELAIGGKCIRDGDLCWTKPTGPTGLIAASISPPPSTDSAGVAIRVADAQNYIKVTASNTGTGRIVQLSSVSRGVSTTLASLEVEGLSEDLAVLVLDDGLSISVRVNEHELGDHAIAMDQSTTATGVGVVGFGTSHFEAHPREVPIPPSFRLHDFWAPRASRELLRDDFADSAANTPTELDNRILPATSPAASTAPRPSWQRTFGSGRFDLLPSSQGGGAKVRGQPGNPCPMRTLYTLPWSNPNFADIETNMTPPGTARFQRQGGRSGLVLWQDPRNHLIVNLWLHDGYDGASISSFLVFDGFDDVYNAVWTNIGPRVTWNTSFRMNVTFDGDHYLVRINDEPVLYRRVTDVYPRAKRFNITRVGLASNWEWGLDTGTLFHNFIARDL